MKKIVLAIALFAVLGCHVETKVSNGGGDEAAPSTPAAVPTTGPDPKPKAPEITAETIGIPFYPGAKVNGGGETSIQRTAILESGDDIMKVVPWYQEHAKGFETMGDPGHAILNGKVAGKAAQIDILPTPLKGSTITITVQK